MKTLNEYLIAVKKSPLTNIEIYRKLLTNLPKGHADTGRLFDFSHPLFSSLRVKLLEANLSPSQLSEAFGPDLIDPTLNFTKQWLYADDFTSHELYGIFKAVQYSVCNAEVEEAHSSTELVIWSGALVLLSSVFLLKRHLNYTPFVSILGECFPGTVEEEAIKALPVVFKAYEEEFEILNSTDPEDKEKKDFIKEELTRIKLNLGIE